MRPHEPQHILLIRPSALGDVCRTVPVLASLRQAFPNAKIDWLVQDNFAAAIEAHPALDEVVRFPRSRFAHWWTSPLRAREVLSWLMKLRRKRYDLVLDCQGLWRSGVMALATGAKTRIGLRQARELAWLGYNRRVPRDPRRAMPAHTVDQMLLLPEALDIPLVRDMRLYARTDHQDWWGQECELLGLGSGAPYAVLAPTSRWLSKRWPVDRFAQLLEPLHQRGFVRAVVIGSPGESEQVRELVGESDDQSRASRFLVNLVGKCTLGQTMAVIASAGMVIANDSAPLHMAVGFARPCVALFGPTNPREVGPYGMDEAVVRGYVPSHPADDHINFKNARLGDSLMRLISTTAVIQRIDRVLALASAGQWPPAADETFAGVAEAKPGAQQCEIADRRAMREAAT